MGRENRGRIDAAWRLARVAAAWALLAGLWLMGEAAARLTGLPLPGAILGLLAYVALLLGAPRLAGWTLDGAQALVRLIGALIVPAAVGLVLFMPLLAPAWGKVALLLVASTLVTGLATAALYRLAARG